MTARKDTFVFQKQEKQYREHCCVPKCTASSKCNGVLSFHSFPTDAKLRGLWLASIRRDNFRVTSHSKVCSLHFRSDQILQPKTSEGRRKLNKGTVPVLFPWNNYSIQPPTPSICDQVSRPEAVKQPMESNPTLDHDYCCVPEPACLDVAVDENMKLKYEMGALRKEIQELKMQSAFGLQRFAGSDDDIQFYTGFASYCHFMMFWRLIEPPVHKMIRWSRSKATEKMNESVNGLHMSQSLQPIDELFLFQMYLAAGLQERDLANRFSIHPFTVSCIISSWTNYLYTLLGSVCIWIDAEDVKAHLPDDFKDFPDTQVIVDCTELKCQTPSSTVLQSEMLSKSHCTMKGLIGMAPHGAVTFVSSLYQGSISDKELLRRSGLADLLTKDMAIMVDKGFLMSDCVDWKVYCPSFPSQNSQMLAHSGFQRQKIARVSAHVERVIQRVKENKLLDSVIPLPIAGSINEIFTVACLLINYQNKPLVRAWAK